VPLLKDFVVETWLKRDWKCAERVRKIYWICPNGTIHSHGHHRCTGLGFSGKPGTPEKVCLIFEIVWHLIIQRGSIFYCVSLCKCEIKWYYARSLNGVRLYGSGTLRDCAVNDNFLDSFGEVTKVPHAPLTDDIISSYVKREEPPCEHQGDRWWIFLVVANIIFHSDKAGWLAFKEREGHS